MSVPASFFNFPVSIGANGVQPQTPTSILQQLLAAVASVQPGYTANLPGSLVEDISSTDVAAIVLCDQARVELINSLSPYAANELLLTQLGQIYGCTIELPTNTSVLVVFSGTVGYVITNGFLVSDGNNTYQVQGGGIIGSSGSSVPLNAICISSTGSFAVAASTVTSLVTSVPSSITLSVTNPNTGTPGTAGETYYAFRQRVLQAGLAASVGTSRYIKTLLAQVPGVSANNIAVQQASGGGIRICSAGGDPYQTAFAIWNAIADPSALVGSAVSSGRNVTVSVNDYPDTYSITYVSTPTQTVALAITWNTVLSNFTGGGGFASLVQQPLAAYINSLYPGQPINVLEMNEIFQESVANALNPAFLTRLVFAVSINGTVVPPATGTYAVTGDPESNYFCPPSNITLTQG